MSLAELSVDAIMTKSVFAVTLANTVRDFAWVQ